MGLYFNPVMEEMGELHSSSLRSVFSQTGLCYNVMLELVFLVPIVSRARKALSTRSIQLQIPFSVD